MTKVNLSIGLYYNEDGIIPQLQAVAEAEARLNAQPHGASLYLPMEGLNAYRNAIAPLLFGAEHRCWCKSASPLFRRWAVPAH